MRHRERDRPNVIAGIDGAAGTGAIDAAFKNRLLARIHACARAMLVDVTRTWESCGKARCARARRCRGSACGLERWDETKRVFER